MVLTERAEFSLLMNALASAFRVECDEPMLEGYWLALDDVPLEAVSGAVKAAMRQCKFMPAAVELRGLSGGTTAQTRAILAWGALRRAVIQHGYYNSVRFDDPYITAAVENLGGWMRVCDLPLEQFETFFRKEFERVYCGLVTGAVAVHPSMHLPGYFEQQNTLMGHEVAPAKEISTGLPPLPLPMTPARIRVGAKRIGDSPELAEWSK